MINDKITKIFNSFGQINNGKSFINKKGWPAGCEYKRPTPYLWCMVFSIINITKKRKIKIIFRGKKPTSKKLNTTNKIIRTQKSNKCTKRYKKLSNLVTSKRRNFYMKSILEVGVKQTI